MDPVRVLAELSGLVVGKLVDDEKQRAYAEDPFGRAFIRLLREGEPAPEAGWRRAFAGADVASANAATVLKRLTRDLLHGITAEPSADEPTTPSTAEPAHDNVRPITDALQPTPGFERATDGRWRPSAPAEDDPFRGYRPRSPSLGSRYPST
jgi:hypothetical protein